MQDDNTALAGYKAVALIYNALMTGLVLTLVTRKGGGEAARFVKAHFRRQHLEKFLPGLKKLGLDALPDAVACAQYHYFSNALGGVKTEYMYESDRKAWVRYPPPRWIWQGPRSARSRTKSTKRCCMAGMGIMAFRSAIRVSASSARDRR